MITYYVRPTTNSLQKGNIENDLYTRLIRRGFVYLNNQIVVPAGFCPYANSISSKLNEEHWCLYIEVNQTIYAILICTYENGKGFYIDYLCRNNTVEGSKGYGEILMNRFIATINSMTHKGKTIK